MTQAGRTIHDVVAQAAAAGTRQKAQPGGIDLDEYVVRQHPSGDRYIVTARSACGASPLMSSESGVTPRSVASTPGRRPAHDAMHPSSRGGVRRSRGSDRRAEQDEQYLQYYSSWKHIATSKTDKEADDMIMSAIQRSPMRRFLEEEDNKGARGKFMSQALEGFGQKQRKVPKPVTLQDKRRKELERMKQVCFFIHACVRAFVRPCVQTRRNNQQATCALTCHHTTDVGNRR